MKKENYHELIARYVSGEISPESEKALMDWVKQSSENNRQLDDARKLWNHSGKKFEMVETSTAEEWNKLKAKLESGKKTSEAKTVYLRPAFVLWKVAAAILVLVVMAYFFVSKPVEEKQVQLAAVVIHQESKDSIIHFFLPDSSYVTLQPGSTLSYSPDFNERVMTLEGEGLFQVKKSAGKSFTVHAAGSITKVLGTVFSLKAYPQDSTVEVKVLSGKVMFSAANSNGQSVILQREDEVSLNKRVGNISRKEAILEVQEKVAETKTNTPVKRIRRKVTDFLVNDFDSRKNAINITVVEGILKNTTAHTSFKDPKLKVSYITKSGKTVSKSFVLNKIIKPGEILPYKQSFLDVFRKKSDILIEIENVEVIEQ